MSGIAHFETFLAEAMSLPRPQRSQLADQLIASLDEDFEVGAAWRDEIHRRAREIDDGSVQALPHEEVMRQAREVIAKGRNA